MKKPWHSICIAEVHQTHLESASVFPGRDTGMSMWTRLGPYKLEECRSGALQICYHIFFQKQDENI